MPPTILDRLAAARIAGQHQLAWLVDPDVAQLPKLHELLARAESLGVDYIFIGGSLVSPADLQAVAAEISSLSQLPRVLFPGSAGQLTPDADAVLFLSLISGRNPEFLIGQHVTAAPLLRQLRLEVIPTGYMLIDGGRTTAAQYMSGTQPLPAHKPDLAAATALAGHYLGLRLMFLDAGSGAHQPVPPALISRVAQAVPTPVVVGGGIRNPQQACEAWQAGATLLVVGTALEDDPRAERLAALAAAKP
jgi:putative glycerol-1-phosphate prenyltransferase